MGFKKIGIPCMFLICRPQDNVCCVSVTQGSADTFELRTSQYCECRQTSPNLPADAGTGAATQLAMSLGTSFPDEKALPGCFLADLLLLNFGPAFAKLPPRPQSGKGRHAAHLSAFLEGRT